MEKQAHNELLRRRMGLWALAATLLAAVVVMLGAWTRLVDAGLGCPDWPGCYGFLTVPQGADQIAVAEARFPDTPVDASKGWPEMIHRYAAGSLGLMVFGLAAVAVRHRRQGLPLKLPLFLAGFILLQGAFGMWTVTLKLWPQVVALHLLGGFTTLSLLALLSLRLLTRPAAVAVEQAERLARLRPWLLAGLVLVVVQIALGAWTAANYAAVACTELPTCQGQWWPAMDFRHGFDLTQQVGPNYLGGQLTAEGRVAIHVSHRLGALAVLGYWSWLLVLLWRRSESGPVRRATVLVGAALVAQVALGLANVALHLPLAIAVAHNALGAGLLLTLIHLLWRLQHCRRSESLALEHPTLTNREATV
ncbi:COX15/CtaA family protein [Marinobacter sp. SS21]|uniref:COX15/CtaA family protein n=1 Tax=Marinobacter sp. SS21 TaxID=2979460 RepID=UPI00232EC86A|nr:COX15/CtaA family protein [Marinobacter sp. SS21]MDC0661002.1 COX15/CtaA family protein [Marinobacter sp. SS21]